MSRSCGWCTTSDRRRLEGRVLNGEPIRLVAASTPFSVSAAHRHLRNHLQVDIQEQRRTESVLDLADFGHRFLALLDDSTALRQQATRDGDGRLAVRAMAQEREILSVLLNRLGLDSEEVLEALEDYRSVRTAVTRVGRENPVFAIELVRELRAVGRSDLAQTVENAIGHAGRTPVLTER